MHWSHKYKDSKSEILSKLAGREIVRDSTLTAVVTTGLYGKGFVQYDRVSIGSGINKMKLKFVGLTGFEKKSGGVSAIFLSSRSWTIINSYCKTYGVASNITGAYGEGSSARLRRLEMIASELVERLELSDGYNVLKKLLSNPFPRSAFVGKFDRNTKRFLLGIDKEFKPVSSQPDMNEIVDHWINRWLSPLVSRDDWADIWRKNKTELATPSNKRNYYCRFCGIQGHNIRTCTIKPAKRRCSNCGKPNHNIRTCQSINP